MLIKSVNSKYIELEIGDEITNVYSVKNYIANILNVNISTVFLFSNDRLLCNLDSLNSDDNLSFKILTSACSICLQKPMLVVGDCKYCKCKFCGKHRLPEEHNCPNMDILKSKCKDKNTELLLKNSLKTYKV